MLKVFLRHTLKDGPALTSYFEDINETYRNAVSGFMIGTISLSNLKRIEERRDKDSSFVLFEDIHDEIRDGNIKKTEKEYAFSD